VEIGQQILERNICGILVQIFGGPADPWLWGVREERLKEWWGSCFSLRTPLPCGCRVLLFSTHAWCPSAE